MKSRYELRNLIKNHMKQLDEIEKDIRNIKSYFSEQQNIIGNFKKKSVRYKVGTEIYKSTKSITHLLKLPIKLLKLTKGRRYIQQQNFPAHNDQENPIDEFEKLINHVNNIKKNMSSQIINQVKTNIPDNIYNLPPISDDHDAIMFIPTNGAGLGHLTRLLSIARRIKEKDPNREVIFFATSSAMHLILQEGFLGYHLPSKMLFPEKATSNHWNELLKSQLASALHLHQPKTIVFDGAFPYAGLISSMRETIDTNKVWIKREQHKQNTSQVREEKEKAFDKVIIPGEAGKKVQYQENSNKVFTNPVIYLKDEELLSRDTVRKMWNVPKDSKVVYVQMGAGNINDINSVIYQIINILKTYKEFFIVLGESIIGKRNSPKDNDIFVLRDYPNSRYFNAFDIAITAAGYNTFHELMYFGVPTIFIPNINTKTDDQLGRAKLAEDREAALIINEENIEKELPSAIEKIISGNTIENMKNNTKSLVTSNGADEISDYILRL